MTSDIQIPGSDIFKIKTSREFNDLSVQIFHYQYLNNQVYKKFVDYLGKIPSAISTIADIPFLPVDAFKKHKIICGEATVEITFSSSGTTGSIESNHYVTDIQLYEQSFSRGFEMFYGDAHEYVILALLPSYLERSGSSLIYMVDRLMRKSGHTCNGFYLYNHEELFKKMIELRNNEQKTILLGVSFALLDFIENHKLNWPELIVMETGGMKGRRKEIVREELHQMIINGLGVKSVHSEYGMTELLSQAYSSKDGKYFTPPWMKIMIRDTNDPLTCLPDGKTGGINIIDLANLNSCSFISTGDLGKLYGDGSFEVLGRFDTSEIRGCNLMVE